MGSLRLLITALGITSLPKLNKLASTKKGLSVGKLKIVESDKAPTNIANRVDAIVIFFLGGNYGE